LIIDSMSNDMNQQEMVFSRSISLNLFDTEVVLGNLHEEQFSHSLR